MILHPQPDLTRKQLLYMAAKKKFDYSVSILHFYICLILIFF